MLCLIAHFVRAPRRPNIIRVHIVATNKMITGDMTYVHSTYVFLIAYVSFCFGWLVGGYRSKTSSGAFRSCIPNKVLLQWAIFSTVDACDIDQQPMISGL
jgi:hypothetical protein